MAGSALMLTHIFFFDNLRLFAMRIVACLSISDSVYALGLLLYVEPQPGYNEVRYFCIYLDALYKVQSLNLQQLVLLFGVPQFPTLFTSQSQRAKRA